MSDLMICECSANGSRLQPIARILGIRTHHPRFCFCGADVGFREIEVASEHGEKLSTRYIADHRNVITDPYRDCQGAASLAV